MKVLPTRPVGSPVLVLLLPCALAAGCRSAAAAAHGSRDGGGLPALAERTAGLEAQRGLFTVWLDREAGRVFLEVPPPGERGVAARLLYVESLSTGLGSNPVGLDRGQLGRTRVVALRRLGGRVLVEEENTRYRADGAAPAEERAARQSFATSVLWAGDVEAADPDGRALVDLTPFCVRDAHGVARTLADAGQGSFELDAGRSALDPEACHVFPDNVELEALLTFRGSGPGAHLADVAPTPDAVTLVQHHSLVRLPEPGYEARVFDPRMGHLGLAYADYAAPLEDDVERRLAVRHRLAPGDTLVYHVDRGAPEPVRSALLDGARWWTEAFEAAGPGFRVELLPEDAHPLDVRYNVVQWVHRSTRGWSYGSSVVDPRTGEILKGHVSLGSLRVRQDRMLFEGLLGAAGTGGGGGRDPVQLALARLRQLSAHEVGHTIGLAHNFAASTYGRASVMDYPAPWVRVGADGALDVSRAYGVGVGEWDRAAVDWLYGDRAPEELARLAEEAPLFLTDSDARPAGAAHPLANLWDNGDDPVTALVEALAVRRHALARFGPRNLPRGRSTARLEEVLVPVYFHHRYQVEAAVKSLGGLDYRHTVLTGAAPLRPNVPTDAATQRRALEELLRCLEPLELDLPEEVLALVGPRPPGAPRHGERFAGDTRPAFDARSAAATLADLVLAGLLQPGRAARLVEQHRRDVGLPGFAEVLDAAFGTAFGGAGDSPRHAGLRRAVRETLVERALDLHASAPLPVRARVAARLARALEAELSEDASAADATGHTRLLRAAVRAGLEGNRPALPGVPGASEAPPGSPIGSGGYEACRASAALSFHPPARRRLP